jgi:hypothetical protein
MKFLWFVLWKLYVFEWFFTIVLWIWTSNKKNIKKQKVYILLVYVFFMFFSCFFLRKYFFNATFMFVLWTCYVFSMTILCYFFFNEFERVRRNIKKSKMIWFCSELLICFMKMLWFFNETFMIFLIKLLFFK